MSSRLDAEVIRRALGDCTIGREISVLEETTSTNDAVLQRATPTTPEGLVVFAEHQTAGRGQRTNRWESAAHKGLWFSILLRPKIDISQSPRLTAWVLDAIAKMLNEQFSMAATIKAPNDIQIDGRKVAGVLVEMRAQPDARHIAIVGIGINLNHAAEDFSPKLRPCAISLAMALNRKIDRQQFAVTLLRNLERTYSALFSSAPRGASSG